MALDWSNIILGLLTLLGGCGWLLDRKKHRQEVEGLKADNRQKDMELGKMYVDEFRSNIADPLRQEVLELRNEIDQLRHAIQAIEACPHRDGCPVVDRLREHANADV